jgi:anaerobic magnesium-protoporphyrin IX monomethyl ester cyclase
MCSLMKRACTVPCKGCYFNKCKFCDIPFINHVSRKAYRIRSPESVVADVHALHARYGVSHFVITDEALSPKLLELLADEFDQRPGDFSFTGYARLERGFTPALCKRLARFGMRKLFFGLESGSQKMLDHMEKGVRLSDAPIVLRNCRDATIDFHLFCIIGLPEETETEARETLRFILDHKPIIDSPGSSFDLHPFGLELRTSYFQERERYGLVVERDTLSREFIIGVPSGSWQNSRGLSSTHVQRLIDTEFFPSLRRTFATWHASPDPLWPPQEEYAVLYASHYSQHPFVWQSCLPDPAIAFAFVLDSARPIIIEGDFAYIHQPRISISLPIPLFRMLVSGRYLTWVQHLNSWKDAPTEHEVRELVDALIAIGLLVVRLRNEARDHGGGM